jgi:hypothetical protein
MDAQARAPASALTADEIPASPGVYAWYEGGEPIYVGKGQDLQERVWRRHLRTGLSMKTSSFRRSLAEDQGVGSAAEIKAGRCKPTRDQVDRVNARVRACAVAWIKCRTHDEAVDLERRMKLEWKPPFTKV